ncbi:MAG: 4Fe-4S dicluster domain-containing protein [Deltaproteobacteria bacterium]|nr:4Fe-4S dicluster domain-containing protein [Deltaproteobacteria bacterium]
MAKKVFVIDIRKCNGCHACQVVCKDEHVGNDWTPIAKSQPDTGQFWIELTQRVRGTVPKVKVSYRPHLCMHCDEAPCMNACPVEGAIYKRDDGLVIIDPVTCTGCKNCVDVCPYNAIFFNEELNIAQKCTGCAHLLDDGWEEPRCADACPTMAIRLMDETEAKEYISQSEVWKPELKEKVKPRVYYMNLPGKFIAGTVYDPVEKEVVIDATCTLTETSGGERFNIQTDDYGDFWFEGLKEGTFDLRIEKDSKVESFAGLDTTEKDINLGDIPLS